MNKYFSKNFFTAGLLIILVSGIIPVSGCGSKEQKTVYNNTPAIKNTNDQNPVKNPDPVKKENINKENNTKGTTKMVHLTAAEFKQKVFNYETEKEWKFTGDKPVIIDFYADWCGPCKMVAPVLEELSKEYDGKVQIYKVDTEAEQELASVFGIRSIPSILFIPMEGKPQMSMGALPKESFVKAINEILLVN
ncbi:MAG TPA: thioredoxin [Ignavibacteria bacterium]|nr:thioredoxin [Ignavibacteria bacterium]HRF67409.1 thioredoxin [Ignavibacteria bacterium]HRJ03106.1 thioredoxin [Ignavibacteria bacterium]HRJ85664.1 thioredoxin [Ignavibacteria bacterium]